MGGVFGTPPNVEWSTEASQAGWIKDRLAPFDDGIVGSEIPTGFASYARILHPLRPYPDGRLVRWAEVAAWSGRELRPDSEFHSIAFPAERASAFPWNAARPRKGTLDPADLSTLTNILRQHTSTPERCWFCIWEGYGWGGRAVAVLRRQGEPALEPPKPVDPIPADVRRARPVELPERNYFLYVGPIEDAMAFQDWHQSPNLFWPDDRSWCVASELGRTSSYVGGPDALAEQLVRSEGIEALRTDPSAPTSRIDAWVEALAHSAARTLREDHEVTITTTRGTITARIEESGRRGRDKTLVRTSIPRDGGGWSESRVGIGKGKGWGEGDLVSSYLAMDIRQLVE